uniref:Uncharacterized protein n=1 Tax=Avena sativa TaxID=4498 RepID=A0ACD5U9S6_AVESA
MMEREEEETFVDDEEESSQCSSGCQSGWTLYLEHSGSGQQQCCTPPCHPGDVRRQVSLHAEYNSDEEDSMVSDASSGPPHHLRDDDEEEPLQVRVRGQINKLRRPSFGGDGGQCCDSGIGGGRRSGSVSGSRSFISTRSRSSSEGKSRKKRRRAVVVQRKDGAGMNRYGVVDDEDLDDTASSSAVVAPADLVAAMHLQQPSYAFMAEHCPSLDQWPAA